jgi:hypothetical protein
MLNPDFLDNFSFGDHYFVNASKYFEQSGLDGYVEIIYAGKLRYLAKHRKMFVGNYTASTPQGSISRQNTDYYLLMDYNPNENLIKISSKRALLNQFPDHKKEIGRFMKEHKIKFKKASNDDLRKLMEYLDTLH